MLSKREMSIRISSKTGSLVSRQQEQQDFVTSESAGTGNVEPLSSAFSVPVYTLTQNGNTGSTSSYIK